MRKNLLLETLDVLADQGYRLADIEWVGCSEFEIPLNRFIELADREYDAGYGKEEVCPDLIVSLKDGSWLERRGYDGAEWWDYQSRLRPPKEFRANVKTLFVEGFDHTFLGECNPKEN